MKAFRYKTSSPPVKEKEISIKLQEKRARNRRAKKERKTVSPSVSPSITPTKVEADENI